MDLGDRPVAAGAQLVLHLHRFDDDDRLARADRVAGVDEHPDDLARHRRHDALRARSRRRRPSSVRPQRRRPFSVTATGDRADVHDELPAPTLGRIAAS